MTTNWNWFGGVLEMAKTLYILSIMISLCGFAIGQTDEKTPSEPFDSNDSSAPFSESRPYEAIRQNSSKKQQIKITPKDEEIITILVRSITIFISTPILQISLLENHLRPSEMQVVT